MSAMAYDHAQLQQRRQGPPLDALHPAPTGRRRPGHRARRGCLHLGRKGKRYLDALAGLFVSQLGHGRTDLADAAAKQAQELAFIPLWSYAHPQRDRAGRAGRELRARRPQPGLLHQRWRRGGRDRVEAGQELLQAHRQADEAQGDQPRDRLPRHHPGRAVDHRPAGAQAAVRAAGALDVPGAQHQLLPRARDVPTTSRRSACGPPTRSR